MTSSIRFLKCGLISVVPKLLRRISENITEDVKFCIHELKRMKATPAQLNIAIEAFKMAGINVRITKDEKIIISLTDERHFKEFIKVKNIAKVESLIQKGTILMNQRKRVLLIGMYADVKNLDKALDTLKEIWKYYKTFRLDYIEVTKLVKLMIEENRNAEEIIHFIATNRQDEVKQRVFVNEDALSEFKPKTE